MRKLFIATLMTIFCTIFAPALAADLGTQDGTYISPICGTSTVRWNGLYAKVGAGVDVTGGTLEDLDVIGGYRSYVLQGEVGYNYQIANSPLVLGGYSTVTYLDDIGGTFNFGAGATVGIALGNAKPYVSAGYERSTEDDGLDGLVAGAGVDFRISQHVVAGIKWEHVEWTTDADVFTDIKSDRVLMQIGYQF